MNIQIGSAKRARIVGRKNTKLVSFCDKPTNDTTPLITLERPPVRDITQAPAAGIRASGTETGLPSFNKQWDNKTELKGQTYATNITF